MKLLAKKSKRQEERGSEDGDANASILAAIHVLSAKHVVTFKKLARIETTETTSKLLESLSSTVNQLVLDVRQHKKALKCIDGEIQSLKEENKSLKVGWFECRHYSW